MLKGFADMSDEVELQWGRLTDEAESFRTPAAKDRKPGRFNGAASRMRRKDAGAKARRPDDFALQWGRLTDEAESSVHVHQSSIPCAASMGPPHG